MWARTSRIVASSTPYFLPYAGTHIAYIAAAVSVRSVPSLGGRPAAPARPWDPPAFTFSPPIAIATAQRPDAPPCAGPTGGALVPAVLHLLDADRHRDVVGAGRDRVRRAPQRFAARRAHVLHARHGLVGE